MITPTDTSILSNSSASGSRFVNSTRLHCARIPRISLISEPYLVRRAITSWSVDEVPSPKWYEKRVGGSLLGCRTDGDETELEHQAEHSLHGMMRLFP